VRIADTVTIAARNAWALAFGSGIEAPDPTPSTVLSDEPHRQLRRFEGAESAGAATESAVLLLVGGPSDLITPPAAVRAGTPNPQWRTVGALRNGPGQPPRHPRRTDRPRHPVDTPG
jgi:hypothetical protein